MSQSDLYKNREPVQMTSDDPRFRKSQRRRSSSSHAFDEREHRRRSKNSGFRRLVHLSRKSSNEKALWVSILIVTVVLLALIGIWQFWYMEYVAREQSKKNEALSGVEAAAAQLQGSAPTE